MNTIPIMITFKGDGKTKIFRYPSKKFPANDKTVVYHQWGKQERAQPKIINRKRIVFGKPPQKGAKIIAVYDYEG